MYTPSTGKWHANQTPPNSSYDANGYVVPSHTADNNSWSGRILSTLSNANAKSAEKQHALGYKYYDTEPGKDPIEMGQYEQNTVTGVFWDNVCSLF